METVKPEYKAFVSLIERCFNCKIEYITQNWFTFSSEECEIVYWITSDEFEFRLFPFPHSLASGDYFVVSKDEMRRENIPYVLNLMSSIPLSFRHFMWKGFYLMQMMDYADWLSNLFELSEHDKMEILLKPSDKI